jgi:hypothetical protein
MDGKAPKESCLESQNTALFEDDLNANGYHALTRNADPGSTTEEEFEDMEENLQTSSSSHDSSFAFTVLCWPLLIISSLFIVADLTLYTLIRQWVIMSEYLFASPKKKRLLDWLAK